MLQIFIAENVSQTLQHMADWKLSVTNANYQYRDDKSQISNFYNFYNNTFKRIDTRAFVIQK